MRAGVWMQVAAACLANGCTGDDSHGGADWSPAREAVVHLGDPEILLVFAQAQDIDPILAGDTPTDADWIAITVPRARELDLRGTDGARFSLETPDATVTFSDVYTSPCNPALEDNSPCWLYEHYTAGEPGLTGSIHVRLSDTFVDGGFDVDWRGQTDRFGPPTQMYEHEYASGMAMSYTLR